MGNRSEAVVRRRNRSGWRLEGSADHLEALLASPVASLASLRRDRDHHNRHKARREEEGQGQGLMVARRVRAGTLAMVRERAARLLFQCSSFRLSNLNVFGVIPA